MPETPGLRAIMFVSLMERVEGITEAQAAVAADVVIELLGGDKADDDA